MTAKTATKGELPPVEWKPMQFIPTPEAKELPFDSAWAAWDEAVRQMDEVGQVKEAA